MEAQSRLSVSVVVAAWPNHAGVGDFLEALAAQTDDDVQVLVVGLEAPANGLGGRFPLVQWIMVRPSSLIPHLWHEGIIRSTCDVVAITTSHFLPASDWLAQVRSAFLRLDAVGIGGPIGPPVGRPSSVWATYFLRYSTQFRHRREETVSDLAGDNAAYRRHVLMQHSEWMTGGFWEPEFHRRVMAEGGRLMFVPAMRLMLNSSCGVRCFCQQRMRHGRQFGRDRIAGKPLISRIGRVVSAPLIPFVMLGKIALRVGSRPDYAIAFLGALPMLVIFIGAWSWGETLGYLSSDSGSSGASKAHQPASV